MPFFSVSARRLLVSCSMAAVVLLAAAGCRSTQSAYQFRPAPELAAVPRPTPPVPAPPAATPAPVAVAALAAPLAQSKAVQPIKQPSRRTFRPTALRPVQRLSPVGQRAYAAVVQPARRGAGATDGAQATAEVGLGTTVLGVLGLILGPISLTGLLIWGGPVWAVLLGLSALAVLIAYLDPFG